MVTSLRRALYLSYVNDRVPDMGKSLNYPFLIACILDSSGTRLCVPWTCIHLLTPAVFREEPGDSQQLRCRPTS
jgi:hypothetical protein